MTSYIIKNCPAYRTECEEIFNFLGSEKIFNACLKSAGISCKDITDCVLKRIVELCDSNASKVLYEGETSKLKFIEGNPLAKKILELLEIEECE